MKIRLAITYMTQATSGNFEIYRSTNLIGGGQGISKLKREVLHSQLDALIEHINGIENPEGSDELFELGKG